MFYPFFNPYYRRMMHRRNSGCGCGCFVMMMLLILGIAFGLVLMVDLFDFFFWW